MVPRFDVEPQVYMKVTDNWVELTMRYVVDPHKRRNASSYIFGKLFEAVRKREDIKIASSTMDLTVKPAAEKEKPETELRDRAA